MSITTKTTAALAAIFIVLLAGAWLILDRSVRPSFQAQEAAVHDADLARLQNGLHSIAGDMRARALDYARWDETYAYVANRNARFIAENFDDSWFINYGADLVILADESGRLLWWRQRGVHTGLDSAGIAGALIEQARANAPQRSAPINGVIWTADGPMIFGAARATHSDGSGPVRGLVIIGRHLSNGALDDTDLTLRFVNQAAVPALLRARFAALPQEKIVRWSSSDTLHTLIALDGADGALAGAVLAERPRDLAVLGAQTIHGTLLMLTLMFGCVTLVLWMLLQRMVIARVVRLERHLNAQGADISPAPTHEDATGDEIAGLTTAYNALTQRLSEALAREREAVAAQETAAAANKMKSDFLANISHELRTPLNDVIGYAELIEEDLLDAGIAAADDDLKRITDAARHLLTLTNEILDLSRIEAEQLDIRPEQFRVDEILRDAVETASVLARAQSSLLRLECIGELGNAYSDQARWRQCLVNVLAFAAKRTHSGVVRLRAERRMTPDGEVMRFEVIDQGAPLNRAQTEALFEPYVRTELAQAQGARLSLSVTRKLAQLLGGAIDIHTQPRSGCVFVLTLKTSLDLDVMNAEPATPGAANTGSAAA
jgi:signal transduction histidine kinase